MLSSISKNTAWSKCSSFLPSQTHPNSKVCKNWSTTVSWKNIPSSLTSSISKTSKNWNIFITYSSFSLNSRLSTWRWLAQTATLPSLKSYNNTFAIVKLSVRRVWCRWRSASDHGMSWPRPNTVSKMGATLLESWPESLKTCQFDALLQIGTIPKTQKEE